MVYGLGGVDVSHLVKFVPPASARREARVEKQPKPGKQAKSVKQNKGKRQKQGKSKGKGRVDSFIPRLVGKNVVVVYMDGSIDEGRVTGECKYEFWLEDGNRKILVMKHAVRCIEVKG